MHLRSLRQPSVSGVFSPSPPCLGAGLMSSGVARTPGGAMTKLRFSGKLQIEDVRKHSEETIAKLWRLLADGATAQADPRRKDFYEVENGRVVYYILSRRPLAKSTCWRLGRKKTPRQ